MSKIQKTFLYLIIAFILIMPVLVYADATPIQYNPIEEIPLAEKPTELSSYVKAVFQFGIAVIGIVSMGAIMVGGYLYIFSSGGKNEKAKQMITNALLGLGLALTSWIIVYTINPDLVELKGIRTVAMDIKTNVPVPPESAYTLCDVMTASWKTTDVAIGDSAIMVFLMPRLCIERATEIGINIDIMKKRTLFGIDIGRSDEKIESLVLAGDQLTPVAGRSQYLEHIWEVPNTLEDGDEVYFIVTGATGIVEGQPIISNVQVTSSNQLKIFPPENFTCEIQKNDGVDWVPTPTVSRGSLNAEVEVKMTSGCATAGKFSLKAVLFNRGNGSDHGPQSRKIEEKTVDITQTQVLFSVTNPESGHYFAEATIVYTADSKPFSPVKRSKRGQDLVVPTDDESCKINSVAWREDGQAERSGIDTSIEVSITSDCQTMRNNLGNNMFKIRARVFNPRGRRIFIQDMETSGAVGGILSIPFTQASPVRDGAYNAEAIVIYSATPSRTLGNWVATIASLIVP